MQITHHAHNVRVDWFSQNIASSSDIVHLLVQAGSLDLLALEVCHRVHEVEDHAALLKLFDEQLLLFCWRCICQTSPTDNGLVLFVINVNSLLLWYHVLQHYYVTQPCTQ